MMKKITPKGKIGRLKKTKTKNTEDNVARSCLKKEKKKNKNQKKKEQIEEEEETRTWNMTKRGVQQEIRKQ